MRKAPQSAEDVAAGKRRRSEFIDFYLPWWFVRQFQHSLEGENIHWRTPVEIAVPQALPEPAKT
jgi:hypothetical protein